jgi:hypothetical protein
MSRLLLIINIINPSEMIDITTNSIFKSEIFLLLITFWLDNLFRHHKCPDASSKLQNKFKFSSKHFILSFTSTATVLSQISVRNAFSEINSLLQFVGWAWGTNVDIHDFVKKY